MKDGRQQEMRARERKIVRAWSEKAEVDVYRARGKEERSSRRKRMCAWRMRGREISFKITG
jgi:hypothetical protein